MADFAVLWLAKYLFAALMFAVGFAALWLAVTAWRAARAVVRWCWRRAVAHG